MRVAGYVASEEDRARVASELPRLVRETPVALAVDVLPPPQCEVVQAIGRLGAGGLRIETAGGATDLVQGEQMVVRVTGPDTATHVHVAYVMADGQVAHLLPAPWRSGALAPGQSVTIGDGSEGGPRYTVDAPFGKETILVLAAPAPVFAEPRPDAEPAAAFLAAMRQAAAQGRLQAAGVVLTTRARQ
ncbi:MAG: DUF4384 domain-containing protein [Alphaproteobacteria bacterium]